MSDRLIPVLSMMAHAEKQPNNIALSDDNSELTWSELKNSVINTAKSISSQINGASKKRVAVFFDGSAEMVIAILAVQLAGGAYIPLEPKIPDARIDAIFAAASPSLILTDGKNLQSCTAIASRLNVPLAVIDAGSPQPLTHHLGFTITPGELPQLTPEMPAVVFFTSGSTGKPKGVELCHIGYQRWFEGVQELMSVKPNDRVALTTNHSFDLSLGEIVLALVSGAALYVPSQSTVRDPFSLLPWLDKHRITIWQSVPSLMRQILHFYPQSDALNSLRIMMFCGEPLEVSLVAKFKASFTHTSAQPLNLYGPVEASVQVSWCWAYEYLNSDLTVVPLGKPLKHAHITLKDFGDGTQEIQVSGEHLALRYLDEEKTRQAFIENDAPRPRYYRTGDIGRLNDNGDIEYQGRVDDQVKINGYRIELSEIERNIVEHFGARDACVLPVLKNERYELAAFVVTEQQDPKALRRKLAEYLPVYMLPRNIFFLDALPLTSNGKRDKVKLKMDYLV
ncbi:amino acid adenylation domain-containing protein [Serratia rhizosphaerae]|uniref:amino acid adenylation domain-containing protein n=1 Tax=Serratia sp. Tan611 TaxID=2773264 RepID=UPI001931BF45|nr:amino acid adenylation domain-containing protein [Serratia sp. Tan611]CAE1147813.1 protein of unknown function [Serratia sp. Tan611]